VSARIAFAAVVAVFVLMTVGNVVSATGSGLACPDWPLCHGSVIPPLRADVLIEYSHRLSALAATVLILATSVAALRGPAPAARRRLAWLLPVLLAVQIALGGITVLLELPDLISTAHLVNALLILGGLIVLAQALRQPAPVPAAGASLPQRLARAGLAVLLVQLALGGYVRHAGAGLACPDFPLCSGDLLPWGWLPSVHWVHRWLGVLLLGVFVHLAVASRTTAARLVAVLAVLQVSLGIATVLLQLAAPVRAAHAAVGYALWATLVWVSVEAGCWRAVSAPASSADATRKAAHAA
jgi:heme A synthase